MILKRTGGARVGFFNATWPFARLIVSNERLELDVSVLGNYSFIKEDIVSIISNPGFGRGIRINHKVKEYPNKLIFWTFDSPELIINSIKSLGFLDSEYSKSTGISENKNNNTTTTNSEIIKEKQKGGGFPLKPAFVIVMVVIWNLLFLSDRGASFSHDSNTYLSGQMMALSFVLIVSMLILVSGDFRKLVLKKGNGLKEVSKFFIFLIFVCGFILAGNLTLRSNSKTKYQATNKTSELNLQGKRDNTIGETLVYEEFEDKEETLNSPESINESEKQKRREARLDMAINCPIIYSIQILATAKPIPLNSKEFRGVKYEIEQWHDRSQPKFKYKYVIGKKCNISEARKLKRKLKRLGFHGAFIVKRLNSID